MFTTTSGTSKMFCNVCLVVLSLPLREGEKTMIAGLVLNKLKKLKGLRFTFPSLSIVLAKHIGRGATVCCKKFCAAMEVISFKAIDLNIFIFLPQRNMSKRVYAEKLKSNRAGGLLKPSWYWLGNSLQLC